jgi:peptide deformylase
LLYFSENILCKRVVSASVARMLLSSKVSITVLFRKCSLQEGCFSVQKVFVTGGLLFSSESVRYKRVAFQFKKCSLQEGCFSVQTVPVARGLLYNLESVRLQ